MTSSNKQHVAVIADTSGIPVVARACLFGSRPVDNRLDDHM